MKSFYIKGVIIVGFILMSSGIQAQDIIPIIKKEVDRNKAELKIDKLQRPFYIRYLVVDGKNINLSATLGSIYNSSEGPEKYGYSTLLVGDYERNNLNYMDPNIYYRIYTYPQSLSLENDPVSISTVIWNDLDKQYKTAAEVYETKQGIISQQQKPEDEKIPDYTKTDPVNIKLTSTPTKFDKAYWEDYIKKASAVFAKYPDLIKSDVYFTLMDQTIYYYDTENSQYSIPNPYYKLHVSLGTLTEDGQEVGDDLYFEHTTFEQMPQLEDFIKSCEEFADYIIQLKNAPLIDEAYTGPVLLEKMALAEAFQAYFFNSALIAKQKPTTSEDMRYYNQSASGGNDFEMMTNKKIISRDLTIKSLSGTPVYNNIKLDGYTPVDAEGVVPAKELLLVENGVLRNMLNGRIPTKNNPASNGHMRFSVHRRSTAVSPGNIQLTSRNTTSQEELKKRLLAAAKEEDLEYAYIIRRLRGNSPLALYRVYLSDGREELVRGAALPDLSIRSFKRVLGATEKEYLYNTYSYGSFVTYIIPEGLLMEELDVTRNNNITFKTPYIVPQPLAIKKR
ncbi:MAG: metallopeptidase TldD-related protein [Bacteroides sp.]|nr:metallopeptidase TldD-related protein [Bacteroides sp.]